MAGSTSLDDDEVISGINVTPLVDIVLVLLIIFMITAPAIYQSAIKVQLPKARTGEEAKTTPLTFTINKEGELLWGKDRLDWQALPARLAALGPAASEQTAIISADQATSHGTVIRLMDSLRQAGLNRFALNVEAPGASR
ncbi:MAG: biopolymer transporter ExbD [Oligoflexia bacterium]|nr:biopolymer transporter ExbD [Oligoflexia bacterium]